MAGNDNNRGPPFGINDGDANFVRHTPALVLWAPTFAVAASLSVEGQALAAALRAQRAGGGVDSLPQIPRKAAQGFVPRAVAACAAAPGGAAVPAGGAAALGPGVPAIAPVGAGAVGPLVYGVPSAVGAPGLGLGFGHAFGPPPAEGSGELELSAI